MAKPCNTETSDSVTLRVDAEIHASRYYRPALTLGFFIALWVLALLADLSWWHYTLLFISCLITLYVIQPRTVLKHISQPPLHRPLTDRWQLLIAAAPRPQLWQAELIRAQHYGWAVRLEFMRAEPNIRPISFIIYADQLSDADWYTLSVLAHSAPNR